MDRPSALDLAFLDLDADRAPMHVGWTLRLEGAPPTLSALRRHLDGRLDAVPRFRRRLARPPLGLGDPHWADDPAFDVARHVHHVRVPAPGGTAELRATASVLLSTPLDLDAPLWRLHLVDGLADGWAVVGQVHHALVDGVAAVELALALFDGLAPQSTDGWVPARPPAVGRQAAVAASRRVAGAAGLARGALRAAAGGRASEALREATRAAESVVRPAPPTALRGGRTRRRAVAWAATPLDAVREAGRRHDATINDVLLAATTIAMRAALERRGERPAAIKALVPVDVREGEHVDGNRISFVAVDLPVREEDPARALAALRRRTAAAKRRGDARPLAALAEAAELLPAAPRRSLTRAIAKAASFSLVVSNVPGPPEHLSLLGRRLDAILPMVPLLDGQALTIGAISYAGRLQVGVAADELAMPDAVELARDLERAFDALRVAPAPAPPPWQARARVRRDRGSRLQPAASRQTVPLSETT
ncbi:wax ester/triacylglycerol synthase family O-acyltransferase [Conexibacter sp. SYSU D00693]|uniref:wax ester/triacylglycerol synthase family O-acyltransferase n=1 Tax=Conexibacter sp. SYSU D00693 TaxID=2812560 RepID=UPI00196B00AE|nr:wax ester/triacylglycerol synthase family O-acyltransferase [Conexibacter sp. SYSU D00693]